MPTETNASQVPPILPIVVLDELDLVRGPSEAARARARNLLVRTFHARTRTPWRARYSERTQPHPASSFGFARPQVQLARDVFVLGCLSFLEVMSGLAKYAQV
jgi:hypothetical protein